MSSSTYAYIITLLVTGLLCSADVSASPKKSPRSFSGGPAMADQTSSQTNAKTIAPDSNDEPRAQANLEDKTLESAPEPRHRTTRRSFSGGAPGASVRLTKKAAAIGIDS